MEQSSALPVSRLHADPSSPAAPGHPSRTGLRRRSLGRAAAYGFGRGVLSGVAATAAMSTVMVVAQKAGLLGQMPPRKITDRFLDVLGVRRKTPLPARRALATLSHFAFGGACGALFGLVNEVARAGDPTMHRRPALAAGLAAGLTYGTAIWAVSYAGWVPALRIMPAPHNDRPGRPTSMILAHWVFGAVLAKLVVRTAGVA